MLFIDEKNFKYEKYGLFSSNDLQTNHVAEKLTSIVNSVYNAAFFGRYN